MDEVMTRDAAEACAPGVDEWIATSTRTRKASPQSTRTPFAVAPLAVTPPLRRRRLRHDVGEHGVGAFVMAAVMASVMTLMVAVAVPAWLENDAANATRAAAPAPAQSRIAATAALQGDTLLAAACWIRACDSPGPR